VGRVRGRVVVEGRFSVRAGSLVVVVHRVGGVVGGLDMKLWGRGVWLTRLPLLMVARGERLGEREVGVGAVGIIRMSIVTLGRHVLHGLAVAHVLV
jgi:hypothetical protein